MGRQDRTSALGPLSPVWAALVAVIGLVVAIPEAVDVFGTSAEAREPGYMNGLILALGLAGGGFVLLRLVQLAVAAHRWAPSEDGSGPPRGLVGASDTYQVWALGIGASLGMMGVLGLLSVADGEVSGLEPGWPLLLAGAAVALPGWLLGRWAGQRWDHQVEAHVKMLADLREERLADPLARIREAGRRQEELSGTPPEVTEASRGSRPESGPSS